jgi:major membrane immunogen (membrane-anchored lipoprotein)
MKFKRVMLFVLTFGFALGLGSLSALGMALQDGVYKVAFDKPDSFGYKAFLEMTVQGGRIESAVFDYVSSQDGSLKSEDPSYEKAMKSKVGVGPAEYTKELVKELLALQKPKVDVVAGATQSSSDFELLARAVFKKAYEGDTTESTIPQPN